MGQAGIGPLLATWATPCPRAPSKALGGDESYCLKVELEGTPQAFHASVWFV